MEPILRNIAIIDWITFLIFFSLLFVVLAKSVFYGRFLNFIILPFNNKYIFMYNKKEKLINWFNLFFGVFLLINLSLFIHLAAPIIFNSTITADPIVFPFIVIGIVLFVFVKMILQIANSYIFGSHKSVSEIIFKKISYFNYSGIIMFLANIFLVYVLKDSKIIVYIALTLIILINLIGWITMIKNHQKFITSYFFYFILYLCALEIAPLILIGSYLKD